MTKLKKLRLDREMTIYGLSKQTGISRPYLMSLEKGDSLVENMSLKKALALAEALGVPVTDLIEK